MGAPRKLASYPSKLPPDFVANVVAKHMPSKAIIEKMDRDDLIALAQRRTVFKKLVESDPIRFWRPHSGTGQEKFVTCAESDMRILLFLAGNKSGKSTAGAVRFLERILGRALWDRETRTKVSYKVPARGVVFAEDFDSHKETTLPTLLTWLPPNNIRRMSRNPAGHVTEIVFTNGSVVFFRTYDQGSDKAEGKDWDIIWCDEPPPRSVYTAAFRGIVVSNGLMLITATLLKETWLYDEVEQHAFVKAFEGTIYDNKWVSESARDNFLATLTEEERMVRETGRAASLTGLVYKNFMPREPFVVPAHDIPRGAPIIMGIDPHERKPIYVEYGYLTPEDEIVWFRYGFAGGALREIFDKLASLESDLDHKPVLAIMDPNRGKARQIDGRCWLDVFEEHGYNVMLGEDNLQMGHSAMREYLAGDKPQMTWMESCLGRGGPVHQMLRYAWEDYVYGRAEKDPREKPKDRNKDFPDIHRYVAMARLSYDILTRGASIIDTSPEGWRERGLVAYA